MSKSTSRLFLPPDIFLVIRIWLLLQIRNSDKNLGHASDGADAPVPRGASRPIQFPHDYSRE